MTAPEPVLAEIITTGSELMLGRMPDANAAWLSAELAGLGVEVVRHTSVGDDAPRLVAAFKRAWKDHNLVLVTGGLGPTEDDLTRTAAARAFKRPLKLDESLAKDIRRMFKKRGYTLTENNLRQALIPEGAGVIKNPAGTAPGFYLEDEGKLIVFMPGVPFEMKDMTRRWALPGIKAKFGRRGAVLKTVILKTAGLGESLVDSLVGDLMAAGQNPAVGLLAAPDVVRVVVTAKAESEKKAERLLAPVLAELESRLQGHVFGKGDDTLPLAISRLLRDQKLVLTILDGVTRGRVSGALTPSLDEGAWGGGYALPWQPDVETALKMLTLHAVSISSGENSFLGERLPRVLRLVVTSRPDREAPKPGDGETALVVTTAIQGQALNGGLPVEYEDRLGGPVDRALGRAASLAMFHLWRALTERGDSLKAAASPFIGKLVG